MKVREITVNAGRTFNHPYENYSNLRPSVTLTATLEEGDDYTTSVKTLQAQAEAMVEGHKQSLLADLHNLEQRQRLVAEIDQLEGNIANDTDRLNKLRGQQDLLEPPKVNVEEFMKA